MQGSYNGLSIPSHLNFSQLVAQVKEGAHMCSKCPEESDGNCSRCLLSPKHRSSELQSFMSDLSRLESYCGIYVPDTVEGYTKERALVALYSGENTTCARFKCPPGILCSECICGSANRSKLQEYVLTHYETGYRGYTVPVITDLSSFLVGREFEAYAGSCNRAKCEDKSCDNCLFEHGKHPLFVEWLSKVRQFGLGTAGSDERNKDTNFQKEENKMKDSVKFKVMPEIVKLPNGHYFTSRTDTPSFAVELQIEGKVTPERVSERMYSLNAELDEVCCDKYLLVLDAEGNPRTVLVPYLYTSDANEAKTCIEDALKAETDEVRQFLRDTGACDSGSRFALQYKTMHDVWNAMCDSEHIDYLAFTLEKLCNVPELAEKYNCRKEYIKALECLAGVPNVSLGCTSEKLMDNTTPVLRRILNPFKLKSDK